jgi:chemotaxis protein CheD
VRKVYLGIGAVHAARTPTLVSTTLGSCLAVTGFSRGHGSGAICHAALPQGQPGGFRYVDFSIRWMVQWFDRQDVATEDIEFGLYGGGAMFSPRPPRTSSMNVGRQNMDKALEVIDALGLHLIQSDIGGRVGRGLKFQTHTGQVTVTRNPALVSDEPEPARRRPSGPAGDMR